MRFHRDHLNRITLGVKAHEMEIPYGVVDIDHDRVVGIREKPDHHVFVNAGIYVLDTEVLQDVPRRGRYDMPDLIHKQLGKGRRIGSFPIHEFWADIGNFEDLKNANNHFSR